jgi:hypothetical protein
MGGLVHELVALVLNACVERGEVQHQGGSFRQVIGAPKSSARVLLSVGLAALPEQTHAPDATRTLPTLLG